MDVWPALCLLGSLILCVRGQSEPSTIDLMRQEALSYDGALPCGNWKCDCVLSLQRSCCCAANDMFALEDQTMERIKNMWQGLYSLKQSVSAFADGARVAFKSTLNSSCAATVDGCFGPFSTAVPLPMCSVTLNDGLAFNPTMGIFTAPQAGVYVFSFTIYSYVAQGQRLYHKVVLFRNGEAISALTEENRDDGEDSASQVLVLELGKGDQVYLMLSSARKLCRNLDYNSFTGYILYPLPDAE